MIILWKCLRICWNVTILLYILTEKVLYPPCVGARSMWRQLDVSWCVHQENYGLNVNSTLKSSPPGMSSNQNAVLPSLAINSVFQAVCSCFSTLCSTAQIQFSSESCMYELSWVWRLRSNYPAFSHCLSLVIDSLLADALKKLKTASETIGLIDDLAYACTQVLHTVHTHLWGTIHSQVHTVSQCYRDLIKGHSHASRWILLISEVFLKVHFVEGQT